MSDGDERAARELGDHLIVGVLPDENAQLYGATVATARLRFVPRTDGVSTTDLIARVHRRAR